MKNTAIKFYTLAFYLISTVVLFASPGDGNGDGTLEGDGDNTGGAPINQYVLILAIVGLYFVFLKFNKSKAKRS